MIDLPPDHKKRINKALLSLEGLSLGDSFGQCFFIPRQKALQLITNRWLPEQPWLYTDDTIMAISVIETLNKFGYINQDDLAHRFSQKYIQEPNRGYGSNTGRVLRDIHQGISWEEASSSSFSGMGSMGNGGAMRAGPIGAYFFDNYERAAYEAKAASQITHSHLEAQAGAMAVAVAAAYYGSEPKKSGFLTDENVLDKCLGEVIEIVPESDTKSRIKRALQIGHSLYLDYVIDRLGNGRNLCAHDTVPISLWFASGVHQDFQDGLWKAISALGDRDTIGAIVGSLIALRYGRQNLPKDWIKLREDLRLSF